MSLGLVTAWIFPLSHVLFGVGLVMAVVAMATHQVRAGLLLLAGTLAGSALCVLVFLSGVLAFLGVLPSPHDQRTSPLRSEFQFEPPRFPTPGVARPFVAARPLVDAAGGGGLPTASGRPLRLDDVKLMLRAGLSDAEVIAAIAGRPRVEAMGPSEAAELRALGAGDRLLGQLWNSRLYADSAPVYPARPVATNVAPPVRPLPPPVSTAPVPAGTLVDHAARDRRIESLKQQINALDDQVRTVRTNPADYRYRGFYAGSGNGGVNQAALQKYLDQLDQQRNALRREKWQLEGR